MNWFIDFLKMFSSFLPVIGVLVATLVILLALLSLSRKVVNRFYLKARRIVFLELTPPAFTDKVVAANEQLFAVLHGLGFARSLKDKLLKGEVPMSFEIVSSREKGIRFFVSVQEDKAEAIEHIIHAYLPEVKINHVDDFMPVELMDSMFKVAEHHLSKHYAYPLQSPDILETHDPIAYLANTMTKLQSDELVVFQIVTTPIKNAEASTLSRKLMRNEDLQLNLSKSSGTTSKITGIVGKVLFSITDLVTYISHGSSTSGQQSIQRDNYEKQQVASGKKLARNISSFEQQLLESIHLKLSKPLFEASVHTLILSNDKKDLNKRLHGVESALTALSVAKYQSLKTNRVRTKLFRAMATTRMRLRLPPLLGSKTDIFSTSELASLFHFPNSQSAKTENIVKSLSKSLPAPVSLKNNTELSILLGENHHQGTMTPIGLTEAERERHLYIIGGTGNGKTTLMLYAILQDIRNGKGVAVLDPHGDLAETILHHIPKDRIKDVIYLNPDDLTHPIGINLLELTPGLKGDELLREKDLVTESTISVLRKIFSEDDSGGHRIEYVLRNTIQTALTLENPTLFTIFRLLNDNKYRRESVKNLEDKDLSDFWKNELGKAGDFQKVKMVAGITAKIGRFLFSASAKRVLEQEKSTIDFSDILDSSKILICNFSKGLLGEDTSTLFGTTILAKLQVAALRRARTKQQERKAYYLYVDEFQNFATMSFVQMLSEARKYKLFLTMAEQSTSQQDQQRLVDIILANVGTVICFRSGSPADERYVLPLFYPYIEQGEISNLPAYNFYMRIAAVEAQEPLSGRTVLVDEPTSESIFDSVIHASRRGYASKLRPQLKSSHETKNDTQSKKAITSGTIRRSAPRA